MTLEAALVIPMVICVITLIILFTYYLYGRCVLSQDAYILAFRASVDKDRYDVAPESTVNAKKDRVVGKKYFGSTKPQFHVTTGGVRKRNQGRGGRKDKSRSDGRLFFETKIRLGIQGRAEG